METSKEMDSGSKDCEKKEQLNMNTGCSTLSNGVCSGINFEGTPLNDRWVPHFCRDREYYLFCRDALPRKGLLSHEEGYIERAGKPNA